MQRYSRFLIALAIGLIAGLYYGWVVNPVEGLTASSDALREDYRTDYVLMVAEIYQSEQNAQLAIDRLKFLKFENPLEVLEIALEFADAQAFEPSDIKLISEMDASIRSWDPRLVETQAP